MRAERVREMIEAKERLSREDFVAMQHDALSVRARRCLPHLLRVLANSSAARSPQSAAKADATLLRTADHGLRTRLAEAARHLRAWDGRAEVDRVGATLFDVFFARWTQAVVRQRFEGETASLLADGAAGLAAALLAEDAAGWFPPGRREPTILAAMESTLEWLAERLGEDMASWSWGRLHTLPLRHFLSGRGDLGELLDHGNLAIKGDYTTVCNAWPDARFQARTGAGYRLIADLGAVPAGLWAIDAQGQSGHPGSIHYRDQLGDWIEGRYHHLPLDRAEAARAALETLTLDPGE
jgi:penicillin amidase